MTTTSKAPPQIAVEHAHGKSAAELRELVADGMLTIPEAVAFSGIGKSQLYELIASKQLMTLKEGVKRHLIPKRALVEHLAARLAAQQATENGEAH